MSPEAPAEDEERLIEQSRTGDVQAFSRLVLRHHVRVRSYIAGYLPGSASCDDLAQEVFLNGFRHLDTYRGEASFVTWLLRIARNRMVSHLRGEARRHSRESESIEAALLPWTIREVEENDTALTRREREIAALHHCLESLPPTSARMVREHYFQARAIGEIARDLGKKEGTVRMTLLRVRQALRECVSHRNPSEAG